MRDRVLLYAIGISFVAHIGAVCVIGRASGSRLGVRDVSKANRYVAVEFARDNAPEKPAVANRPTPPPEPPKHVTPPHNPTIDPPKPPSPVHTTARPGIRPGGTGPAGNPGSPLNPGTPSANGEVPSGGGGNTPMGWVPGNGNTDGQGSGNGKGRGDPDPAKHVDDGPSTHPAPQPVTPPPPRMVSVRVCGESGLLPGEHCKNTRTKSFVDGEEPTHRCNRCKAPEPQPHANRLADSAVPVLVSDSRPKVPDSVDEGLSLDARVEYWVEADGSVSGASIGKSSGNSELDRAILSAASRWKYKPAVQDGVPRRVKMTRTVRVRT